MVAICFIVIICAVFPLVAQQNRADMTTRGTAAPHVQRKVAIFQTKGSIKGGKSCFQLHFWPSFCPTVKATALGLFGNWQELVVMTLFLFYVFSFYCFLFFKTAEFKAHFEKGGSNLENTAAPLCIQNFLYYVRIQLIHLATDKLFQPCHTSCNSVLRLLARP